MLSAESDQCLVKKSDIKGTIHSDNYGHQENEVIHIEKMRQSYDSYCYNWVNYCVD